MKITCKTKAFEAVKRAAALTLAAVAALLCACGAPVQPNEPPVSDDSGIEITVTPSPTVPATIRPTVFVPTPSPEPTPEPVYYKSRVHSLNCRTSPSTDSDDNIVCEIGFETPGIYLGEEGDFTKLRLEDGKEVYCYSDFLVPIDTVLYAYLREETAQKRDIPTGELVFESDGVTPVMVKNELVDMRLYLPDAEYELLFATERNITGGPLYPLAIPLMQKSTVEKLMKAYEIFKADGYTLKVYDAYRPRSVQRILFDIVQNKHWIANPDTTASNHNRGCAIDMSLIIDATGEEIETPTPMHTFTEESGRKCETWTETARANVDYITAVMKKCGFNSIQSEWWHYADTNSKKFMTTDINLGGLTMLPKQED